MLVEDLKVIIENNLKNKTCEFKRVFHGRGNFYEGFNYLTIDSIDKILLVSIFESMDCSLEEELFRLLEELYHNYNFEVLIVQRRYLKNSPSEVLIGQLDEENIAIENGLKYSINFNNKNIGIFLDMKLGREFIKSISKDKNVLNLFSYTCAFSISSHAGGAKKIVNVDMAKGALSQGRKNHHLNNQDTKIVKFMPYNILKSWSRIKKEGPYDIIIIDPPSFQKGSFAATKDYEKIIKKLSSLTSENCVVLSCLNAPELDSDFIKDIFQNNAPEFKFSRKLDNLDTFPSKDEEKSLKNLVFVKDSSINTKLCPLCGKHNNCQVSNPSDCWCMNTKIPKELLDLVSDDKKMKACICKECVDSYNKSS